MKIEKLRVDGHALEDLLLPRLFGKVFHVTTRDAFKKIKRNGSIHSNADAKFPMTFSVSENSGFRRRGCVSVFDLREVSTDIVDNALIKLNFLNPEHCNSKPVFLFLDEVLYAHLKDWKHIPSGEMVIPHVEAGVEGQISLDNIRLVLLVDVVSKRPTQWERDFIKVVRQADARRNGPSTSIDK